MLYLGSLVETTNGALRVERAPSYVRLRDDESFLRSIRTGQQYIATVNGIGFRNNPSIARIALFTLTTEVENASIYGRRGKFVTGNARTLASNVVR